MFRIAVFQPQTSGLSIRDFDGLETITYYTSELKEPDLEQAVDADMVLIAINQLNPEVLGALKKYCEKYPKKIVMLFLQACKIECLIEVMKIGILDVAVDTQDIDSMILRNLDKLNVIKRNVNTRKHQKIGLLSVKGGDGGTSILANLATAFSKDPSHKVLLIDLSLLFGDVEIYATNQTIKNDLSDFCDALERLDISLISNMIFKVSDNFHLIPTVSDVNKLIRIDKENVKLLIEKMADYYDTILFDMSLGVDPINIQIIDKLDSILLVSTLSIPSARRATQILRYLDILGVKAENIKLIISRLGGPVSLTIEEYEKTVGINVWHKIYRDYTGIEESVLKGIPLVINDPDSKFSISIIKLCEKLSGHILPKKSPSWKRLGIF